MGSEFYNRMVTLIAVIVSITIHEFAHAFSAVKAGDDTPRFQGRISLNPIDHFDIVGFTMIVLMTFSGFGIGWGKPVMVNPYNFRHPRWDDVKVSLWGPLSNLILAAFCALLLRTVGARIPETGFNFVAILFMVNVGLAAFNLIPLPPLDGSHVLAGLLPYEQARAYGRFAGQYGMLILILLLVTGTICTIIRPIQSLFVRVLLGV